MSQPCGSMDLQPCRASHVQIAFTPTRSNENAKQGAALRGVEVNCGMVMFKLGQLGVVTGALMVR